MPGVDRLSSTSHAITLDQNGAHVHPEVALEGLILLEPHCSVCLKRHKPANQVVPITGREGTLDHGTVLHGSVAYPDGVAVVDPVELSWRRKQEPAHALATYVWSMDSPGEPVATLHVECYACLPWLANQPSVFATFRWVVLVTKFATACPSQSVKPVPEPPIPLMARLDDGSYEVLSQSTEEEVRAEINILGRILKARRQVMSMLPLQRDPIKAPLTLVEHWSRNLATPKMIDLHERVCRNSVWRIHVDEDGLFQIDRLPRWPGQPFNALRDPSEAWALIGVKLASKITVVIKQGLARLELPFDCSGLQLWDTPNPPRPDTTVQMLLGARPDEPVSPVLENVWADHAHWFPWNIRFEGIPSPCELGMRCRYFRRQTMRDLYATKTLSNSFRYLYTIPLRHGATFLYDDKRRLVDIYPGNLALEGRRAWPEKRPPNISYMHVPLGEGDEIEGMRADGCFTPDLRAQMFQLIDFTVTTKLAGEVHVGMDITATRPLPASCCMRSHSPRHMIYGKMTREDSVDIVGCMPDQTPEQDHRQFNGCVQNANVANLIPRFYSEAPLKNVVCVRIFRDDDDVQIIGLLLHYRNGAKRAMGEYRPGMYSSRTVMAPARVYFDQSLGINAFGKVDFMNDPDHFDGCDMETCFPMRGLLTMRWDREVVEEQDGKNDDDQAPGETSGQAVEAMLGNTSAVTEEEEVPAVQEKKMRVNFLAYFGIEETNRVFPTDLPYNP